MENFGSFDNEFMWLENVMPKITHAELYKRTEILLRKPHIAKQPVFTLDLRYGGGVDLQTKTLRPGERIQVPKKFGNEVIQDFRPQGDICATNPGLAWYTDESERAEAVEKAMIVAQKHYHTVGAVQMESLRADLGHTEAQVKQFRNSRYATYILAQEKEKLILENLGFFKKSLENLEKAEQKAAERKAS